MEQVLHQKKKKNVSALWKISNGLNRNGKKGRKKQNWKCIYRNRLDRAANGGWNFTRMLIWSFLRLLINSTCPEYPHTSTPKAAMHEMLSWQDHKNHSLNHTLTPRWPVLNHIHLLNSTDFGLAQLTDTPRAHGNRPAGRTTQCNLHTTSPPSLRVTFLMHPAQPARGSEFPGVASPVTSPARWCNKPSTSSYVLKLSFYLKMETS